jgi:IclR family KDG regulon transcriptional repressor
MDTTVAKGLSVLELLARSSAPVRLSAVAEQLGLQKSNAHRLLSTLTTLGYVTQETETGRYHATLKTWELGAAIIAENPAKRAAAPYLQDLHRITSETVNLTVLDGLEVIYLDKILTTRPLRVTTQVGTRLLAAITAAGRSILAHEPGAREILERTKATYERTADLDIAAVMADLREVRERGYATHESATHILTVAAPIMGRGERAAAALSVTAPAERLNGKALEHAIESVLATSARIGETVGQI